MTQKKPWLCVEVQPELRAEGSTSKGAEAAVVGGAEKVRLLCGSTSSGSKTYQEQAAVVLLEDGSACKVLTAHARMYAQVPLAQHV